MGPMLQLARKAQPACDKVTPLRANAPAAVPRTTHGILTSALVDAAEKVEVGTFSGCRAGSIP